MRDALNYLQLRHTKLQYLPRSIIEGGGIFHKIGTSIPLEIEEISEEHAEEQLQVTIEDFLRRPYKEHLMRLKVLFGPKSCEIILGASSITADTAATGLLANDLLTRYSVLCNDPSKAPTEVEIAPVVDEIANAFPKRTRTSMLGWRGVVASLRHIGTFKTMTQSHYRLSSEDSPGTFFSVELSPELTKTLEANAIKANVDLLSAFSAAATIAAEEHVFHYPKQITGGGVNVTPSSNYDLNINHNLRTDGFQPAFPNETMMVAEAHTYHQFAISNRNVWDSAMVIYRDCAQAISQDTLFDAYHFEVTAASAKARNLSTVPNPSFTFQDARDLELSRQVIDDLKIEDIRYAETPVPGNCKVVLSKFKNKLQVSFSFPSAAMTASEAEKVVDGAIELLRPAPPTL